MVVAIACQCDDLPAHSHAYKPILIDGVMRMVEDPYDVIIWVDWKAIARSWTKTNTP